VQDKKKGKGIPRIAFERTSTFEKYVKTVEAPIQTYWVNTSIHSFKQKLYTIRNRNRAINSLDIKRYVLPDGIRTLAYGHVPIYHYTRSDIFNLLLITINCRYAVLGKVSVWFYICHFAFDYSLEISMNTASF
jgi:hypothetical protein